MKRRFNGRPLVALWAILGFSALILQGVVRMTPLAFETVTSDLTPLQTAGLFASVAFFGLVKGHAVFHRRFAPRFAARLRDLLDGERRVARALAPLACIGLVPDGTGSTDWIRSLLMTAAIVLMIIGLRGLDAPWRGIIVTGVACALAFGWVTTVAQALRVLRVPAPIPLPVPEPA